MQFFTPLVRPKDGLGTIENQCPWEKMGQNTQMSDLSIGVNQAGNCETCTFLLCATVLNLLGTQKAAFSAFQRSFF